MFRYTQNRGLKTLSRKIITDFSVVERVCFFGSLYLCVSGYRKLCYILGPITVCIIDIETGEILCRI